MRTADANTVAITNNMALATFLSGIHGVVSDHAFDGEWKQRFPNVQFICSDKEYDQS